jgi:hypothetical protein
MVPWLGLLSFSAFLCSLPPSWTIGPLTIPGPTRLFYLLAPMFRAHARFGFIVGLGVSMLAGLGFAALLRSGSPPRRALAWTCVALAVFELAPAPPWHWRDILPTAAHRWLVDHDVPGKTLDCVSATDPAERSTRQFFGPRLIQLGSGMDCGVTGLAGRLAARSVRHLIVRRASRVGAWFESRPVPSGLHLVGDFGSALLFDVDAAPAQLEVDLGEGFYAREYDGRRSYRWMGKEASLRVVNRDASSRVADLRFQLNAFPRPRQVTVSMDGTASRFALEVGMEPMFQEVGPFEFPPGVSTLRIDTDGAATVADDVLHNGDRRALALSVGAVRLVPKASQRP